jgi:peptide/nickel transport system ATP-binding protein
VSFEIQRGEAYGIVGESGCGKSTVAFGVVNFLGNGRIVDGSILFQGRELRGRSEEELRLLRGDQIAMVYQDPMQALNPAMRIGDQLSEVLIVHRGLSKEDADARCVGVLQRVCDARSRGSDAALRTNVCGQQQRVVIAEALNDPALLMDEPTTALDVRSRPPCWTRSQNCAGARLERSCIAHNLGDSPSMRSGAYARRRWWNVRVANVFLRPMHPHAGLDALRTETGRRKASSYLYPILVGAIASEPTFGLP